MKKLFIFDLDGTLVDAYTAIHKSLNFTLKKLEYPSVTFQKAKQEVGGGDRAFMRSFFRDKDIEKALKIYRTHHKKSLRVYSRLKPYAKRLLYILKKKRKKIAVASNRPRYFTDIILKKTGIEKYLDYVLCADQIKSLKPNPKILNTIIKRFNPTRIGLPDTFKEGPNVKKEEVVFIGDMAIDLETAKRTKIDAIFVKGGSSALKDIRQYRNKRIVSSIKEILSFLG